jgi:hypothetical protein
MLHVSVVKRIALKFAIFSACALPVYAGYLIPSIEWGSGTGQVSNNVNNYSGPTSCSLSPSASTCTESIASNQPPNFLHNPDGSSSGTISASVDGSGAHLYAEAGVSGQADTTVAGYASFYDTVYNPTASAKQFQLTFHLDATLFTRSSTVDQLQLDFSGGNLFQTQLNYGGAGTYSFIDQDFTTAIQTVAANSSRNWQVILSTTVVTDSQGGTQYLAGLPTGYVDAGNTLSFTAISVFDAQGNPVSSSGLTSYAGFDYSTSSTSATPEPASAGLLAIAAVALMMAGGKLRKITA